MENELDIKFAEYLTAYFYNKGYEDGQNEKVKYDRKKIFSKMLKDCIDEYKKQLAEEIRKDNPHHHLNRFDQ